MEERGFNQTEHDIYMHDPVLFAPQEEIPKRGMRNCMNIWHTEFITKVRIALENRIGGFTQLGRNTQT